MHIQDISYIKLNLQLKKPYTIAYETIGSAINYILQIKTDEGDVGYGCAAPDFVVTGEVPNKVEDVIKLNVIPYLVGKNPYHHGIIMDDIKKICPLNMSVLTMVDMALYDLLARRARLPLYQVLGGYRQSIPTSVTIGILPEKETLREAKEIINQGFYIIKLKGGLDLAEDLQKLKVLRKTFGSKLILRFDGNQGYSIEDTTQFIKEAYKYDIEILEQPIAIGVDVSTMSQSSNIEIPIMADESLKSLKDAFRIANNTAIDMINIKIQKVGGITQAMHINSVSKAVGNDVMIGCLDECALGISAGLHFALSRPNVRYADLDAHLDFINDPFSELFTIKEGIMRPTLQPGLGKVNQEVLDLFS